MADKTEATDTPEPRFAVFDSTLGNYVSGVMSKTDAAKAAKAMAADKDAATHGHELEARPV